MKLVAQVRYAFNRLVRDNLDRARHFVSEAIGSLNFTDMNPFVESLKIAYNDQTGYVWQQEKSTP